MPVAPLAARATGTPKPTGLQSGSTNPIVIVRSTCNLHHFQKWGLTRNAGHSNCSRPHLHINSTLRLYCKATASKLLHQPKQKSEMAALDGQGQTATSIQEKVGRQECTGSRDFIHRDQCDSGRIYHAFPGRDSAERWCQSQHFNP